MWPSAPPRRRIRGTTAPVYQGHHVVIWPWAPLRRCIRGTTTPMCHGEPPRWRTSTTTASVNQGQNGADVPGGRGTMHRASLRHCKPSGGTGHHAPLNPGGLERPWCPWCPGAPLHCWKPTYFKRNGAKIRDKNAPHVRTDKLSMSHFFQERTDRNNYLGLSKGHCHINNIFELR